MLGNFNQLPFNRTEATSATKNATDSLVLGFIESPFIEFFVSDSITFNINESNFILNINTSDFISIGFTEGINFIDRVILENLLIATTGSISERQLDTIDNIAVSPLEIVDLLNILSSVSDDITISIDTIVIGPSQGIVATDSLVIDVIEFTSKLEGADVVEAATILLGESQALLVTTSGLDPPIIGLTEVANYTYELPVVTDDLIVSTIEINPFKEYFVNDSIILTINDQINHNRELASIDSLSFTFVDGINLLARTISDIIFTYTVDNIVDNLVVNHNLTDSLVLSSLTTVSNFEKLVSDLLKILIYSDVQNETQIYIKIDGIWCNIQTIWIKVDGTWRLVLKVYNKVSDTWELR